MPCCTHMLALHAHTLAIPVHAPNVDVDSNVEEDVDHSVDARRSAFPVHATRPWAKPLDSSSNQPSAH